MIAPEASAGFVANMEDVLEVYQRPRDLRRPVVCLDETSKQMMIHLFEVDTNAMTTSEDYDQTLIRRKRRNHPIETAF